MNWTTLILTSLMLAACVETRAQEKPEPPKPQPEKRPTNVAAPDSSMLSRAADSSARGAQGLPKFDLPEYVITGVATIDLPETGKQESAQPPHVLVLPDPVESPRDRQTAESDQTKAGFISPEPSPGCARILASLGTYFTSKAGLWLSSFSPESFLQGDAHYSASKDYVRFSNRSGGEVNIAGGVLLNSSSEWYNRGMLRGDLGYASETYRFFGIPSSAPPTRSLTTFRLNGDLQSSRDLRTTFGGNAGLLVTGINDSSSSMTETVFQLRAESNLLVGPVPLDGRVDLALASTSGANGGSLPYLDVGVLLEKTWIHNFFIQASGHFYLTQGMQGQRTTRVYPHAAIGYRFSESSIFSVSYAGRVQFNTLASLLHTNPYLSAADTVRQSDLPVDLDASLETNWNDTWRTRFSARYQSIRDYPLLSEAGSRGIWTTAYRGTTSIATYAVEVFAKFGTNGYFTASLETNSTRNSFTQWRIPYLPDSRLSSGVSFELVRDVRILPSVSFVDRRATDLYAPNRLKAYVVAGLRGEYNALSSLNVFVDCQNLTNSVYEEWNGYRAMPFVIAAGLSIHW